MKAGEFIVTVIAILIGLVLGKYISRFLADSGVPIAAGDPVPQTLPGGVEVTWRRHA